MTTPPPPPPAPGGAGNTITVNKDNVLAARKAVLEAAAEAEEKLRKYQYDLAIDPPAKDDISVAAATAWNRNLLTGKDSHFNRLMDYVAKVRELGEQLGEAARQYGFTEEQIEASFKTVDGLAHYSPASCFPKQVEAGVFGVPPVPSPVFLGHGPGQAGLSV